MLRPWFVCLLTLLSFTLAAPGDTVVLKDKAAITGTILAEKRDSVAVDIGYTVLVVPRSSVAKISKDDEVSTPVKALSTKKAGSQPSRLRRTPVRPSNQRANSITSTCGLYRSAMYATW